MPFARLAKTVNATIALSACGGVGYFYYLKYRGTHSPYYALALEQTRRSEQAMRLLGGELHADEITVMNGLQRTHIASNSAHVSPRGDFWWKTGGWRLVTPGGPCGTPPRESGVGGFCRGD